MREADVQLVAADEDRVEDEEAPAREPLADLDPAVVLVAAEAALAPEVPGQAQAPRGGAQGHEQQPRVELRGA